VDLTSGYIHHVPGRLRVKLQAIKRSPQNAEAAQGLVKSLRGVISAEANTLTGSIVIKFDAEATKPVAILNVLQSHGYLGPSEFSARPDPRISLGTQVIEALARAFLNAVVERVIEQSAIRLIAALI
jgi:hypothetical protein